MYIKEFSQKTGLSIDTLRFYEQEALLFPKRNANNYRIYTEEDFCWVQLLLKMKQTGMTIENIKKFAELQVQGVDSLPERIVALENHIEKLHEQQNNLTQTIAFVNQKISGYRKKITTAEIE
ncbi:MerR family transcriptional regulator [Enterococcus sp. 5H]|uniref:MerR family transcriptional regulator n=1 Tax=Enterococcus sp. 5H TaxID=1229490 RepID=UPI00230226D6|nr:MerR family transcriptional regulator [Enterococcus sp. 5H]MDA9470648.1 MerR family transcription regulator [Enterococcus sp. 5H]